jgi:hypothetical protein
MRGVRGKRLVIASISRGSGASDCLKVCEKPLSLQPAADGRREGLPSRSVPEPSESLIPGFGISPNDLVIQGTLLPPSSGTLLPRLRVIQGTLLPQLITKPNISFK